MRYNTSRIKIEPEIEEQKEPVKLLDFVNYNDDFSEATSSYHYVLKFLLEKGIITKKSFYLNWMKYVLEVKMQRELKEVDGNFDEEDLEKLVALLVKNCNKCAVKMGLRIIEMKDELTDKRFIMLSKEKTANNNQKVLSSSKKNKFKEGEHKLKAKLIHRILKSKNGHVSRFCAMNQGRKATPKPMNAIQVDELLERMKRSLYLKEKDGKFSLGIKAAAELPESLLIGEYKLKKCSLCDRIIFHKRQIVACSTCKHHLHSLCHKTLSRIGSELTFNCPRKRCKGRILKSQSEEVKKEEE